MSKSRTAATAGRARSKSKQEEQDPSKDTSGRATRETVESIVVAVILAFLFRAFVAEAFVIPTGSMAPTLQGRHMDVVCEKCSYQYRTGASVENKNRGGEIVATTCPICRYTMELDKYHEPNQRSFNGDRILVSKFTYEFSDPKRWDVIVFKYPGNAKQNYIKRLVGLPNETLLIRHGDIYHRKEAEGEFRIVRKPPYKLKAMMHLADDTKYRAQELIDVGWPPHWQDWKRPGAPSWRQRAGGRGFETTGDSDEVAWLRYRHVLPTRGQWEEISDVRDEDDKTEILQRLEETRPVGQLVTDYYEYNDGKQLSAGSNGMDAIGQHWVGDLAVEYDVQIEGDSGRLLLDLVEGGVHYTCRIDVATGEAVLSIDGGQKSFIGEDGVESQHPKAMTKVRGSGAYRLRFSNCDDELLLWVNNRVATFDGATTYVPAKHVKPKWSVNDPGDLEPAGIGAEGIELKISRLRLYRDVYYVATSHNEICYKPPWYAEIKQRDNDYILFVENGKPEVEYTQEERSMLPADVVDRLFPVAVSPKRILDVFTRPSEWSKTNLFDARCEGMQFALGEDEFFPLGDNSPQSRDARLWAGTDPAKPHVKRKLLTGKALVIYWPHSWRRPIPFLPNFKRMGLIR